MLVYKYNKERYSNELFSYRQGLNVMSMSEELVLKKYSKDFIDKSNSHIAFILFNSDRARMIKNYFMEELDEYLVTMKVALSDVIKKNTFDCLESYNRSFVLFLSEYNFVRRLRGFHLNVLISHRDLDEIEVRTILRVTD